MTVASELATVYRGGGRRWFSLAAACNAEAGKMHRERYKADCYCCKDHYSDQYGMEPGETCQWHMEPFQSTFRRRVARLVMRDAKKKDMV